MRCFALTPCANGHSNFYIDLKPYEKRVYSQNGEEGVLEKIFELIETTSRYYVEFGEPFGDHCNTRIFRERGWNGLLMGLNEENLNINLRKEWITAENVNDLFKHYDVPIEFDLLSVDVDYNDFYIWHKICDVYRPRVVIIEYNATHLPSEDKVVEYDPNGYWDGTNYFGASILAFYKLGRKAGYSLIYAEEMGVNLFFIRDDVVKERSLHFKNMNCVDLIYKPPQYGSGPNRGHAEDLMGRAYISAEVILSSISR